MSRGAPLLLPRLFRTGLTVRFVLVGIWNTLFGYGVFCLLDTVFPSAGPAGYRTYLSVLAVSNVLAIMNAFVFHKYITFRSAIRGLGILLEFMRFSLTYAFSFCVSLVLMPAFVEVLRVRTKPAAGMTVIICTAVSYIGHSKVSFSPGRRMPPGG